MKKHHFYKKRKLTVKYVHSGKLNYGFTMLKKFQKDFFACMWFRILNKNILNSKQHMGNHINENCGKNINRISRA